MESEVDKKYFELVNDILENGTKKEDRTGTGTYSVFGRNIRINNVNEFPALTTKKMAWKQVVTELLWFLRGDTNIKWLVEQGNYIWVGDAFKRYRNSGIFSSNPNTYKNDNPTEGLLETEEEFIEKIKNNESFARYWGELGPIYGKQWRNWKHVIGPANPDKLTYPRYKEEYYDQIKNVIKTLKENPDSRRIMVSAWNVGEINDMTLPPCHFSMQFYTRKITENVRGLSLMWNQRSCDVPLGLPFNITSYALLLHIIANMVDMVPESLIGSLGDCHIYTNQLEGIKEQLERDPNKYNPPELEISDNVNFDGDIDDLLESCSYSDFKLKNYESYPRIKFPLSN